MITESREWRALRLLLRESIQIKFRESQSDLNLVHMEFNDGRHKFSADAPNLMELLLRIGRLLRSDHDRQGLGDTIVQILEEPE